MDAFEQFPAHLKKTIRYVLTDIDDTLTLKGLLPAVAYLNGVKSRLILDP
jgi:hypothetical protein